jgi:phosphatidylserine/phosphatidylglycerophosphate/cardiolipin synthase-like enzyme
MNLADLISTYVSNSATLVGQSAVQPLIDAEEYFDALNKALATVGTGPPGSAATRGEFVYIMGWWFAFEGGAYDGPAGYSIGPTIKSGGALTPVNLPRPSGTPITKLLEDKATAGVDVRVLGWTHFLLIRSPSNTTSGAQRGGPVTTNTHTVATIQRLRRGPIGANAALNVVSHTAGAVHPKLAVVGDSSRLVGFTGGIDLVSDRWATTLHLGEFEYWHDIAAQVEGPGAQAIYDFFVSSWNENIFAPTGARRRDYWFRLGSATVQHILPSTAPIAGKSIAPPSPTPPGRTVHVQGLRTLPARNFRLLSLEPPEWSWSDTGVFEVRDAWRKAIVGATDYVYMEDQGFWSPEILTWLSQSIKAHNDLRVILLIGAPDPNDPVTSDPIQRIIPELRDNLLAPLNSGQRDRIRLFRRWGDTVRATAGPVPLPDFSIISVAGPVAGEYEVTTTLVAAVPLAANHYAGGTFGVHQGVQKFRIIAHAPVPIGGAVVFKIRPAAAVWAPTAGSATLTQTKGVVIHSKITLVDDHWAIIGSANALQRSLYTDVEHAIAFIDESDEKVRLYRKRLWAHHFRHGTVDDFHDLKSSLHSWESSWFAAGAAPGRPVRTDGVGPEYLQVQPLGPIGASAMTHSSDFVDHRARFADPDSRQPWGWP